MNSNIEIKIVYDEREIKKALSFYILKVCDMQTYALITYPIIFIAIVWSLIFSDYILLPIVFFFCGTILFYFYYRRPIEGYLKFYKKRKDRLYRFNDDKVFIIGEGVQSECLWSVFKKSYEIPSAFLLVDDNEFIYIFPKSCFNNTTMVDQMRDLLAIKAVNFKINLS